VPPGSDAQTLGPDAKSAGPVSVIDELARLAERRDRAAVLQDDRPGDLREQDMFIPVDRYRGVREELTIPN
jgi:hypothetical protein